MIEVIHANALDVDALTLAQFHLLLVDPPYSEHVHANAASVGVAGGEGLGAHARDLGFAHLSPELRAHVALAASSVQRWSVIYSDFESTHEWRATVGSGAEYIRLVPWIRWSQPQLSGDRPPTGAEAVSIFHRHERGARGAIKPVRKHWNGPGSLTFFDARCMRGKYKHPTEKPLDLILSQVSWFSDPGEAVIDLCAGSGTTAVACRLLDRECVCVELDQDWARQADTRSRAPLSARDHARAEEWIATVTTEAQAALAAPAALDGSDRNTRERAERRLADAERVRGAL